MIGSGFVKKTFLAAVVAMIGACAVADDYMVEVNGEYVTVYPTEEDLVLLNSWSVPTNKVAYVNAALNHVLSDISPTLLAWHMGFMGLKPNGGLETRTAELKKFSISSFDVASDKVSFELSDEVKPMFGRGVDIFFHIQGSTNLTDWAVLATATNTTTLPSVTPISGETKKFYRLTLEYAKP